MTILGTLIALIGCCAWLFADPGDSAPRQTVAALWLVAGMLGFLIAAVGTSAQLSCMRSDTIH